MSKKTLKKNEKFLKETVEKLQNQLTKFIINTNYTNSYSLSLRQKLSNFETKLQKKIQHDKKTSLQQSKQISDYRSCGSDRSGNYCGNRNIGKGLQQSGRCADVQYGRRYDIYR